MSRLGKPYLPPQIKPLDRWVYPYAEGRLSKDVNGHVAESIENTIAQAALTMMTAINAGVTSLI